MLSHKFMKTHILHVIILIYVFDLVYRVTNKVKLCLNYLEFIVFSNKSNTTLSKF